MDTYVRARVCVCVSVCAPGGVGTDKVSFKDWEQKKKKKRLLHVKQAALSDSFTKVTHVAAPLTPQLIFLPHSHTPQASSEPFCLLGNAPQETRLGNVPLSSPFFSFALKLI